MSIPLFTTGDAAGNFCLYQMGSFELGGPPRHTTTGDRTRVVAKKHE